MSTATISKTEYNSLLRDHQKLAIKVSHLESLVGDLAQDEEVNPAYLKKWEKISKAMDKGKGVIHLKSISAIKKYFASL